MLLFDEPAALDAPSRAELARLLRDLAADGHTILLTARTLAEVADIADRVVLVGAGRTLCATESGWSRWNRFRGRRGFSRGSRGVTSVLGPLPEMVRMTAQSRLPGSTRVTRRERGSAFN
ncbi:MAG TPA: hypothetical protein VMZ00_12350 [Sporichthya sp.]|nr:hypothetical protein [Sporichthya sp.]